MKKTSRKSASKSAAPNRGAKQAGLSASPSRSIDKRIGELDDWRGKSLARVRALIKQADPDVVEEWKWNVPVWSHDGLICTGETYKSAVKLTFARGASLPDPSRLFNSSLEGKTRRAIDIREGDRIDADAFKALVKAAVRLNTGIGATASSVKLLSGGNPQIAKGDGDVPVQAYIAAMPGWKRDVGQRLDAIIEHTVPNVRKAVKWNTPFYGVEERSWFVAYHCFDKYIKVTFFRGTSLRPPPPVGSKQKDVRYYHIHDGTSASGLDEFQFADWIKQASQLPGERL
jgi:hypothetical protein